MRDPTLDPLLSSASAAPDAPVERFVAAIPRDLGKPAAGRWMPWLVAAGLALGLGSGLAMFAPGLVPGQSGATVLADADPLVQAVYRDVDADAFAAALSGEADLSDALIQETP